MRNERIWPPDPVVQEVLDLEWPCTERIEIYRREQPIVPRLCSFDISMPSPVPVERLTFYCGKFLEVPLPTGMQLRLTEVYLDDRRVGFKLSKSLTSQPGFGVTVDPYAPDVRRYARQLLDLSPFWSPVPGEQWLPKDWNRQRQELFRTLWGENTYPGRDSQSMLRADGAEALDG